MVEGLLSMGLLRLVYTVAQYWLIFFSCTGELAIDHGAEVAWLRGVCPGKQERHLACISSPCCRQGEKAGSLAQSETILVMVGTRSARAV